MGGTYRMVVGVDGSEGSLRALRWAAHEARNRGGTVQAVVTYDWVGTEAALLAGLGPEGEQRRAEEVLAAAVGSVSREYPGVPIAGEVLIGRARNLTQAARDADRSVAAAGTDGCAAGGPVGRRASGMRAVRARRASPHPETLDGTPTSCRGEINDGGPRSTRSNRNDQQPTAARRATLTAEQVPHAGRGACRRGRSQPDRRHDGGLPYSSWFHDEQMWSRP
jgi:hypothetical protein